MLILYLAFIMTAMYFVVRVLGPELSKPLPSAAPKQQPKRATSSSSDYVTTEPVNRVEKLESLLAEKNKNINMLQTELKLFLAQVREFDKMKSLYEQEIQHLREQNRIFRAELGMPTIASYGDNSSVTEISKRQTSSTV